MQKEIKMKIKKIIKMINILTQKIIKNNSYKKFNHLKRVQIILYL